MYRTYLIDRFREMCVNHSKVNIIDIDSSSSDDDVDKDLFEASESDFTERNKSFSELEFILKQKYEGQDVVERYRRKKKDEGES